MAATQIALACLLAVLVQSAVAVQPLSDQPPLPDPPAGICEAYMSMTVQLLEGLFMFMENSRGLDDTTQADLLACQTSYATPEEVAICRQYALDNADQSAILNLNSQLLTAEAAKGYGNYLAKCKSTANTW